MEEEIIEQLLAGQVGILATDTLYGVVASALKKETVERIYAVRKRDLQKPMIILISVIEDLKFFGVRLSGRQEKKLQTIWPGAVSVVLACNEEKFEYLHRGSNTLAFRLPKDEKILGLLEKTGPLVAPSANLAGQPPAVTIKEAKRYFGDRVDFYVDSGMLKSESSTIIKLEKNGEVEVLRQGGVKIKK